MKMNLKVSHFGILLSACDDTGRDTATVTFSLCKSTDQGISINPLINYLPHRAAPAHGHTMVRKQVS